VFIAIVEDNQFHLEIIEDKISKILDIPYELKHYLNAQDYIEDLKRDIPFDIVLLDIDLGEVSGIFLGNETNQICPYAQIIYVSSYENFMSDVYETQHIYFINKKQIDKYLPLALEKAINNIHKIKSQILFISWKKRNFQIVQKNIIYIERKRRVTHIVTENFTYQTTDKINDILSQLNNHFVRCHNSYIVNLNYLAVIQKYDILLQNGIVIPVSRSHARMMKQAYSHFLIQ